MHRPRWERLADRWPGYTRWTLVGVPLVLAGLLAGITVAIVSTRVFTGDDVVARPTVTRAFAWPLRLTRRVNVLLVGVDVTRNAQRQVVPAARADTLMLVTFDPGHRRAGILSVPRDVRVIVPGMGENKINAAYTFGGAGLTIRTVEDLLGVPVHYYVKLGIQSFARIVDAVGGIEIDVEKDMQYTDTWAGLYIDLKKGRQVLSGEQAMHYIRWRNDLQGDIGRVARQQKVLRTVLEKLRSPAAAIYAPRLLTAVAQNTQTNLTLSELITLGLFTTQLSPAALHTATVPGEIGLVYVEADMATTRAIVTEMFLGIDPAMVQSTAIEVLNGSDVPGLARQTAARLERLGFQIVRVDTAPQPARTTTLIVRTGRPEVTQVLADLLGNPTIARQVGDGPDITIVVARDIAPLYPVRLSGLTP